MERALEDLIWHRAERRCEYCQIAQDNDVNPFEIDHILAVSHGGPTRANNLALSCFLCNSYKGTNLAGLDPKTKKVTRLFHPRRHSWHRHFAWQGPVLRGRTPVGRATVAVPRINLSHRINQRAQLIDEGVFPPESS
jgi:hypothetical protein